MHNNNEKYLPHIHYCNLLAHYFQFLLYEQDGVLLTTKGISGDNSNLFLGKLRIIREVTIALMLPPHWKIVTMNDSFASIKKTGTFITWMSEDSNNAPPPTSQEPDWTVIADPNQGSAGYHSSQPTGRPIHFDVEDLKCICLSSLAENHGKLIFYH